MKQLRSLALDVLALGSVGSLVYGAHLVYRPAAFILGGLLGLALVVGAARLAEAPK